MNRVQVAHTVSTIATLSLISWATLYWRHAFTARNIYLTQAAIFAVGVVFHCLPPPARPACRPCRRGLVKTAAAAGLMWLHANNVKNKLQRDTDVFRNETQPRWNASLAIFRGAGHDAWGADGQADAPAGSFADQLAGVGALRGVTALAAPAVINRAELDNTSSSATPEACGASSRPTPRKS